MKNDKQLIAEGLSCPNLTPEIKKAIKDLGEAQILEVFNNDPASREGIPAWCRLTGNELVNVKELNDTDTLFYIKKKLNN
jgi:TusA-related sulfurtransferase